MIFVTVGTHEQPFDRLIRKVDNLIKEGTIQDKVIMQIGYSNYEPKYCEYSKFLTPSEMTKYMSNSNVVITHGGPSTFMKSLSIGKKTIVVPRQKRYKEHVNDHQLEFAKKVKDKGYGIEIIDNINDLDTIVLNSEENKSLLTSNNHRFVSNLTKLIEEMMD